MPEFKPAAATPYQNATAIEEAYHLAVLEEVYVESKAHYAGLLEEIGRPWLKTPDQVYSLAEEAGDLEPLLVALEARINFAYACARYVNQELGVDLSWDIPE